MQYPDRLAQILSYSYLENQDKVFQFVATPKEFNLSIMSLVASSSGLTEPLTPDNKLYLFPKELTQFYILCNLDRDQTLAENIEGKKVFQFAIFISYVRALEEAVNRIYDHFALPVSEVAVDPHRNQDAVSSNLLKISDSVPQTVTIIPADCDEFITHQPRFQSNIELTAAKIVEVGLQRVWLLGTDD